MREIFVADCETDPFKKGRIPAPFIWGLYNGKEFLHFNSTETFLKYISEKEAIVYAHNGGKFDWHFLLDYLTPFSEIMVISGRIARFKIGACEFRDSYNIIPVPLSAYQKTEIEYWKLEAQFRAEYWDEILSYLKDDCVFLFDLVDAFIKEYGVNITLASTALKQLCKIEHIRPPKTTQDFYNQIKPFYHGGRVECFHKGEYKGEFTVVDVNSAYPKAMTEFHPYGAEYSFSQELPLFGVEQCFISLSARSTGAFPYRTIEGLSFPNDGKIRDFHITGWEYIAARDLGILHDETIKNVIEFDEKITFKKYVKHFFDMKAKAELEKNAPRRLFAKLMLNSAYGKYAADPAEYEEYMIIDPKFIDAADTGGWNFAGLLGKWAVISRPLAEDKQHYYNVAVAASITGNQRARLLRGIYAVEKPLYGDTDSIAAVSMGSLIIGKELGEWSVEAKCDYAAIAGKKLYAFHLLPEFIKNKKDYKIACKGVRLTPAEIIRVAQGERIKYENEAPTFSYKKQPVFLKRNIVLTN